MSIVTDKMGQEFLAFHEDVPEAELLHSPRFTPLTHALIVVKHPTGFLLMFNKERNQWEIPGGRIDAGESLRDCIVRELFEETNQTAEDITFKGVMRFRLLHPYDRIEYGALFAGQLKALAPFTENDEAGSIALWDMKTDIGYVNEIDVKLIAYR